MGRCSDGACAILDLASVLSGRMITRSARVTTTKRSSWGDKHYDQLTLDSTRRPLQGAFLIPPAPPVVADSRTNPPPLAVRLLKALPFPACIRFTAIWGKSMGRCSDGACAILDLASVLSGRMITRSARVTTTKRSSWGDKHYDQLTLDSTRRPLQGAFLIPPAPPVVADFWGRVASVSRERFRCGIASRRRVVWRWSCRTRPRSRFAVRSVRRCGGRSGIGSSGNSARIRRHSANCRVSACSRS